MPSAPRARRKGKVARRTAPDRAGPRPTDRTVRGWARRWGRERVAMNLAVVQPSSSSGPKASAAAAGSGHCRLVVHPHRIAQRTSKQRMDGNPEGLTTDIPDGHVNGADGRCGHRPTAPSITQEKPPPDVFRGHGIHPDHDFAHFHQSGPDAAAAPRQCCFAQAGQAFVGSKTKAQAKDRPGRRWTKLSTAVTFNVFRPVGNRFFQ